MKITFLILALSFTTLLQARSVDTTSFGTLKKERCADSGGVFAIDYGCQRMSLPDQNDCEVELKGVPGKYRLIIRTHALKETGDHRKTQFKQTLKRAYMYQGNIENHLVKFDRDTSAEVQLIRQKDGTHRVEKLNLYTKHVMRGTGKNQRRTFHQYSCTNLK